MSISYGLSLPFIVCHCNLNRFARRKRRKGNLGTVVEMFGGGSYLVEVAYPEGVTYVLTADQLIKVYQELVRA